MRRLYIRLFGLYLIFLFVTVCGFAQKPTESANQLFHDKRYKEALPLLLDEYKLKQKDVDLNSKIGQCYLNTRIDKSLAIQYLEFSTKQPHHEHEDLYRLGQAYHYALRLESAIGAYGHYKEKAHGKDLEKVVRSIEWANNAKELIKTPIDVKFENLGKEVNSEYPDYYPFIPADESFVAYTTRRKSPSARLEFDGEYSSDIYMSEVKAGIWTKGRSLGPMINTADDEEAVGMTHDGHSMLIYIEHTDAVGDIYVTHREKHKAFGAPASFSETINTDQIESSGSLNMEENTIIFASNRPGGFGGYDIYISHILPDGNWGPSVNLGPEINTKYDEDFPQLSDDGMELYFCSKGHNSMGGYDVFESKFDLSIKHWGKPRNVGYPINTPDDDMHYAVSASGHEAYISRVRPEGLGDLDIYRVIINNVESRMTTIIGNLFYLDTLHPANKEIQITVIDKSTNEPYAINGQPAEFKYNPVKKKFLASLPAGVYTFMVEMEGFAPLKTEIKILDKIDYVPIMKKKFILYKPGQSQTPATPVAPLKTPPKKKAK